MEDHLNAVPNLEKLWQNACERPPPTHTHTHQVSKLGLESVQMTLLILTTRFIQILWKPGTYLQERSLVEVSVPSEFMR